MRNHLFHKVVLTIKFSFVLTSLFAQTQSIETPYYVGNAFDQRSKQLVYVEEYQAKFDDQQNRSAQVIYQNPEGNIIAKKDLQFQQNPLIPKYDFEDFRDGYLEGVSVSEDSIIVHWRENRDARTIKKALVVPEPVVVDMGFHYFIQKNWEPLWQGEMLFFNFVVPSKLNFFSFQINKIKEEQWHNQDVVVYKMELENAFLRLFIAPILLTYHAHSRQLLIVEGLSIINDKHGKSLKVIMLIDYFIDE